MLAARCPAKPPAAPRAALQLLDDGVTTAMLQLMRASPLQFIHDSCPLVTDTAGVNW